MNISSLKMSTKIQATIVIYIVGIAIIGFSGWFGNAVAILSKIGTGNFWNIVPGLVLGNLPGFVGVLIMIFASILLSAYFGQISIEKKYGELKTLSVAVILFFIFSVFGLLGYFWGRMEEKEKN